MPLSPNGTVPEEQRAEPTRAEPNDELESRRLLQAVAGGDGEAFWELWSAHRNYLYTICLRHMGGIHADAEDALSRAMMRARDRLPEHAAKIANLKAWLARLTNNLCIDVHRERRRRTRAVEDIKKITSARAEPLAAAADSPEALLLRQETSVRLSHLIGQLPHGLRQPFILRFIHEATYEEIAARLRLTNENVRKRVQQARAVLREKLIAPSHSEAESPGRSDKRFAPSMPSITDHTPAAPALEIESDVLTVRLVRVAMPSGGARSFHVLVSRRPRQGQRIETLDKYVRSYPGGWKKRWERACLLYEAGRWAEAVAEHRRVIERQPAFVEAHLQLGNMFRLLGDEGEAMAAYGRALASAAREATRHHVCGLMESCVRRYGAAVSEFQQASLLEPDRAIHRHRLASAYLAAGSYVKALQTFDESLNVNPDDVAALTCSYPQLLAAGRTGEAGRRVARALELDPENFVAMKRLIDHRCRSGAAGGEEWKQTSDLIRAALRCSPEAPEAYESAALYHIFRGAWSEGLSLLRAFVGQHPDCPAGWLYYARCAFQTGEVETAAAAIDEAARLDPEDAEIRKAACRILAPSPSRERLRSALEVMLASCPEQWDAWAVTARVLVERFREPERAAAVSACGPRLQPQLAAAWFQHGKVLALSGRHREAMGALQEGWKWLPGDADDDQAVEAALLIGESHRALGDERLARVWFERAAQLALALSSQHPAVACYRRGQVMEALGDRLGAIQNYQAALANHLLYPARAEAQQRLQRLQARARPHGQT